ncbi:major facilitator superfamily domain-containing protein [Suillus spraguei]|nr:major facilitator superfamily domain-containing protein [Suillus spraguei]
MVSEQSPLLASTAHKSINDRFAPHEKRWIVFLVSCAGLLPMFVQGTFVPSIPQIAKDLTSTHATVSLSISVSILATAVGSLVWASYSSLYGRRLMYLWGMPFLCAGSCGVAMSTSLWSLLFWRFVQTFGCSGGIALGAGVIGDIYKLEERGAAIGVFYGATLLGLAIAPFLGGTAAQYWSWRNLQYSIGASDNHLSFHILTAVQGLRYGIVNEAIIGACFLPNGLGNFMGAPISGRLSDTIVRRWRKKRNGVWFPEDRLRATWIGGLFMVPLSVGASGLITTYVGGPIGLSLNLLCFFMNGMGVDFVFNPIASYNVDIMHSRSAEITAANAAVRSLIISVVTALVIPSIECIGVAWTNIIAAILAIIGQGIIFLTIRYGDRMRACVDVGFSTTDNNS